MGRKPVTKNRINNPEQKQLWLRQLLPVYTKQGLRKFSMDEVAAILDISKATLYKHFTSREEIIEKALELKLMDMATFKEALFDNNLPYIDRYFAAINVFFSEISGISVEFLSDLKILYPTTWQRVEFFREYALSQIVAFYKEGISNGYFNNIDPAILTMNDKWFFDSISDPDFLREHHLTLQKAFSDYFNLRCFGLFKQNDDNTIINKHIEGFIGQFND